MLGGYALGEDALGSQGGARLVTLDASAGAFSIAWYGLKPSVLGGSPAAYSLSGVGQRLKTRVPFANGVLDTYENGQKTYIAQPSAGALTIHGYEPTIVYTQFIPQTQFPFWIFLAGEWAWVWLIWYIQIGWFNGQSIRHITWNVGPDAYFVNGSTAWLAAPSTTQRVTAQNVEIVYSMSTTLTQRLTNMHAEVVYVPQVSQHLTSLGAEVLFSLKKVLQPDPATFTIASVGATIGRTAQTLDATAGAYTLAPQTASIYRNRRITATLGAITLDPQTATFLRSLRITATTRAYAISGAATLVFTRVVTTAQGSFALSGQNATLLYGRVLSANAGAFTLAPQTANLHWPLRIVRAIRGDAVQFITSPKTATLLRIVTPLRTLDAAAGVILWRGRSADSLRKYVLTAAQGVLGFDGLGANLRYAAGRSLLADHRAYLVSGQAASFQRALTLNAAQGTYVLAPQSATILRKRLNQLSAGAYVLDPQAANLRKTAAWALEHGAYVLVPQNASLVYGRSLAAAQGSYDLTLNDATLATVKRLQAAVGTYTLAPGAAGRNRTVGSLPGSIVITGRPALISRKVLHQTGEFSIAATDANLFHRYVPGIIAIQSQYAIAGVAATLARTRIMDVAPGAYTLSPTTVTLAKARQLAADAGEFLIEANDADVRRQLALTAQRATFIITGFPLGDGLVRGIVAAPGEIVVDASSAVLTRRRVLTAARGAFTIDGRDMTYRYDRGMTLGVGAFTIDWKLISTIEADGVAKAFWERPHVRVDVLPHDTDAKVTARAVTDSDLKAAEITIHWE